MISPKFELTAEQKYGREIRFDWSSNRGRDFVADFFARYSSYVHGLKRPIGIGVPGTETVAINQCFDINELMAFVERQPFAKVIVSHHLMENLRNAAPYPAATDQPELAPLAKPSFVQRLKSLFS